MAGKASFRKMATIQAINWYGSTVLVGLGLFFLLFGMGAVLSFVAGDALRQFALTSPVILLSIGGVALVAGILWYKITAP